MLTPATSGDRATASSASTAAYNGEMSTWEERRENTELSPPARDGALLERHTYRDDRVRPT